MKSGFSSSALIKSFSANLNRPKFRKQKYPIVKGSSIQVISSKGIGRNHIVKLCKGSSIQIISLVSHEKVLVSHVKV